MYAQRNQLEIKDGWVIKHLEPSKGLPGDRVLSELNGALLLGALFDGERTAAPIFLKRTSKLGSTFYPPIDEQHFNRIAPVQKIIDGLLCGVDGAEFAFIIRPFVDGPTLDDLLLQQNPDALAAVRDLASAMYAIHSADAYETRWAASHKNQCIINHFDPKERKDEFLGLIRAYGLPIDRVATLPDLDPDTRLEKHYGFIVGDPHGKNFVWRAGRIYFIDLDSFGLGYPEMDAGRFLGYLDWLHSTQGVDTEPYEQLFLQSYPRGLNRDYVQTWRAFDLLKKLPEQPTLISRVKELLSVATGSTTGDAPSPAPQLAACS